MKNATDSLKFRRLLKKCEDLNIIDSTQEILDMIDNKELTFEEVMQTITSQAESMFIKDSQNRQYKRVLYLCSSMGKNAFSHMENGKIIDMIKEGVDVPVQLFEKNDSLCRCFISELSYHGNDFKLGERNYKFDNLNECRERINKAIDDGIITL